MSRPTPPQGPDAHRALPATEVLLGRNTWLIRLRWLAVAGTLVFLEVARLTLPIRLYQGRLYLLIGALAAYNLVAWLLLRRQERLDALTEVPGASQAPDDRPSALGSWLLPRTSIGALPYDRRAGHAAVFALSQVVIDLLFLALLLHFTGGIENPVRVFFIFHVIFASVLLSAQATFVVASLSSSLLAAVALGEMWGVMPHYSLEAHWGYESYQHPALVLGNLFLVLLTIFVTAYLATSIAGRLRRREVDVFVLTRHLAERAERLQAAYQELSIAEKSKSQYMRKVAHELRAPLGTVKTALAVALQTAPETMDPQTRTIIERAERRAGALAEMTQELLSLSRAKGGQAAAEMVPLDFAGVAARTLEELQEKAQDAGVSLTVELQIGLPPVRADAEGLADLLVNLIGNAIRYTPSGGRVWFRARRADEGLLLEVEDTGIGIDPADRSRIFDEFYRTPAGREHTSQGSGLGLAIVKAVVEQHRGTISVEDRAGGGTRFRVELPFAEQPALAPVG